MNSHLKIKYKHNNDNNNNNNNASVYINTHKNKVSARKCQRSHKVVNTSLAVGLPVMSNITFFSLALFPSSSV